MLLLPFEKTCLTSKFGDKRGEEGSDEPTDGDEVNDGDDEVGDEAGDDEAPVNTDTDELDVNDDDIDVFKFDFKLFEEKESNFFFVLSFFLYLEFCGLLAVFMLYTWTVLHDDAREDGVL